VKSLEFTPMNFFVGLKAARIANEGHVPVCDIRCRAANGARDIREHQRRVPHLQGFGKGRGGSAGTMVARGGASDLVRKSGFFVSAALVDIGQIIASHGIAIR
jgi:hypothetical protein